MDFSALLFDSKNPNSADPVWLIVVVITWTVFLIVLSVWGPKVWKKEHFLALHKTLKKSSFWLKFFGVTALILLWFDWKRSVSSP